MGSFSVWLDRNVLFDSKEDTDNVFLNVQKVRSMRRKMCRSGF